jgi:small conductance mechanosensitive channel
MIAELPGIPGFALRLGLILLVLLIAARLLAVGVARLERRLEADDRDAGHRARLRTLLRAGRGVAAALLLASALLAVLHLVGIEIGPILAGAGVVGLGLSLGAQFLIRDFLGGILILVEDQFRVGDVISVGTLEGTVERIALRATYLRDAEGRLHIVPNGEIRTLSNLTADWARAVVDFPIDHSADVARALEALREAGEKLAADESVRADQLDSAEIAAWNAVSEWGTTIRVSVRTAPGKQWAVARALRRYGLEALHAAGVPLAVPAQRLVMPTKAEGSGEW